MTGRDRNWLAAIALLFLAWRVPLMYRTVAGQDEDWFAVPGVTILRTGVPQIPYLPSRSLDSAVYKADVALYALPPLGFYLQALVNLVLGPGLGPSRMTSALSGLVAIFLVYDLGRIWSGSRRAALLAAFLYSLGRPFYFPATTARPDMPAVMFGLLAVRLFVHYRRGGGRASLVACGVAAGLSLLAHPFGVVPATQVGLALLVGPGGWRRRIVEAMLYGLAAALAFGLWVPLILLHPDIFRIQFGVNVLHRAGPGLGSTLLAPWPVVAYQARQFLEFATPPQTLLLALGVVWAVARARGEFLYHVAASILLLVLFEGRHPTLGYYAFPAAFASLGAGMLGDTVASAGRGGWRGRRSRSDPCGDVAAAVALTLLPGAGLRPLLAQIRHRADPLYNARALARTVLADIPPDAMSAIDGALVLDAYLAGRPVVDLTIHPLAYDVRTLPFEYAVFSRVGLRLYKPEMADLVLLKTYGDEGDPFAPYAELYRRGKGDTESP